MSLKPSKPELIFHASFFTLLCVFNGFSLLGLLIYVGGVAAYKAFLKPRLALGAGKVLGRLPSSRR